VVAYAAKPGSPWPEWLCCQGDQLYVRRIKNELQLANWKFKKRGRGHATALLHHLETLHSNGKLHQEKIVVENVGNEGFAAFLRRRHGWVEQNADDIVPPSFVYG
jgi:hypothetical protein